MAKAQGLGQFCPLLEAQLMKECGTLDAYCHWHAGSPQSDHGWAIGMAQWHLCYQYPDWLTAHGFRCYHGDISKIRDLFYVENPQMRDWRYQVSKYLGDIRAKMVAYRTRNASSSLRQQLLAAIDSWNANPSYVPSILKIAENLPSF